MAKPRVFISSTYFDLKNVRADLERFVRDRGFDPVLHERGNVPYGKESALEEYCYREIGGCDIIVANDVTDGAVFGQDHTSVYLLDQQGESSHKTGSKIDVAAEIVSFIAARVI